MPQHTRVVLEHASTKLDVAILQSFPFHHEHHEIIF